MSQNDARNAIVARLENGYWKNTASPTGLPPVPKKSPTELMWDLRRITSNAQQTGESVVEKLVEYFKQHLLPNTPEEMLHWLELDASVETALLVEAGRAFDGIPFTQRADLELFLDSTLPSDPTDGSVRAVALQEVSNLFNAQRTASLPGKAMAETLKEYLRMRGYLR